MKDTSHHDDKIAKMSFATVYPLYINKIERKGRTKVELNKVIEWLTGYNESQIEKLIQDNSSFEVFFKNADLNPNAHLIKGLICGYRVEEIENTLTQQVRYIDKLVDELAKGKSMDKILRK